MVLHNINGMDYFVDPLLVKHWERNTLKIIDKTNSDRFYVVDGRERSGKSTWTFQQAAILDKKMFENIETFISRICFTPEEFFNAATRVKNGVIIFDEAFRGLSSRGAMSKVNKKIIQVLQEMGQNNNIVFLVLPSFFMLDTYPAMLRSNGLFNIKIDKNSGRRIWRGYNYRDKNTIYQVGMKRGWSYPIPSPFKGNFYSKFPGGDQYEAAYLDKKARSLREMDKIEVIQEDGEELMNQKVYEVYKEVGNLREAAEVMESRWGVPMKKDKIAKIVREIAQKHLLLSAVGKK